MGLELLRKEILDAAAAQAQKADSDATAIMHGIVRSAHTQAKEAMEKAQQEGKAFVDTERSERLSAARLEAGRTLSEAREDAVNAALEKVWAEFCKRRNSKNYPKELLALADKASSELSHGRCVLCANAQDRRILLAAKRKVSNAAVNCVGGVAAETLDGKIRVDCTFEEIFAQNREAIRKEIYARMFPQGRQDAGALQKNHGRKSHGTRASGKRKGIGASGANRGKTKKDGAAGRKGGKAKGKKKKGGRS